MKSLRLPLLGLLALGGLLLAGCGQKSETTPESAGSAASDKTAADKASTDNASPEGPMAAELAATVSKEKDFYIFKTISDLPTDLKWENGSDLPEFADPDAKKGGTFNYFMQDFPRTLRVVGPDSNGGIRQYIWDYVEMYPAREHPNFPGRVYPGYATEWAPDPATRTVYYRINPAARWSDGVPLTTDDVVFTLYFLRSPYITDPWYNDFHHKTWAHVTVYDKYTFALTLTEMRPDFVVRCSQGFYLFPKHAMGDFGPDYVQKFQWRPLPTLGAYTLKESDIDKGRSVTLTRVKDWWAKDLPFWRGLYNPDRYRLTVIHEVDKAFESFTRGDLDFFLPMTTEPKYWYDRLPDDAPDVANGYIDKVKFYDRIPQPDWGLWINSSRPLLDQPEIRLGVQYAADFQLVCQQYFRGDAVQMRTRNDGYPWHPHPDLPPRTFDPVKAREHFAAAGFTTQGPDGVLVNDKGQRLSFTLTTYLRRYADIMAILKTEALKAGLELNIELLDETTGWKKVQEKNHDIALIALSRFPELFPRYWELYHGSNAYKDAYLDASGNPVDKYSLGTPNPHPTQIRVQTNNMTETFIPELDRLIEAYESGTSLDEMGPLAVKIEQIIYDDASWVPGWSTPFYRMAYWRWVKWPKDFNVMISRNAEEYMVHWIDVDAKKETLEARKSGKTFPPALQTYDKFREEP